MEEKNIYQKLSNIQAELKVPKGQRNSFGNYKYRSCEDILEEVKPICKKHETVVMLSDELVNIGDRYYIKATAGLFDLNGESKIYNTAYAREEEIKKGMDGSQITGTASSYARKYALNGLFNIDDTKDADTDEYAKQQNQTYEAKVDDFVSSMESEPIYIGQKQIIENALKGDNLAKVLKPYNVKTINELNWKQAHEIEELIDKLKKEKLKDK